MVSIDFGIGLALLSLFGATILSNLLARLRDKAREFDPITREARELLLRERARPIPLCPTLVPEHWARLEAVQPGWRRKGFVAAKARYTEARSAFSRNRIGRSGMQKRFVNREIFRFRRAAQRAAIRFASRVILPPARWFLETDYLTGERDVSSNWRVWGQL